MKTGLGFFAIVFMIAAAYFLYAGLSMETVVNTGGGDVANFQLMHVQTLDITIGIGSAIIAALFVVGATLKSDPPA